MASNNVNKIYRSDKYTPEALCLVKKVLAYSPETGKVVWKVAKAHRLKKGQEAGSLANTGYRQVTLTVHGSRKCYLIHHIAWALYYNNWPSQEIDHINGTRTDNRIENLRAANRQDNCKNLARRNNNKSGAIGVYWYDRYQKWTSRITYEGKLLFLGYFDSFEEAVAARKAAELKYGFHPNHGRDAST